MFHDNLSSQKFGQESQRIYQIKLCDKNKKVENKSEIGLRRLLESLFVKFSTTSTTFGKSNKKDPSLPDGPRSEDLLISFNYIWQVEFHFTS